MEDIEAINEMFPDDLLTDADFEKALDALCANPDEEFKREITELMSEHQIITWEEAEQILGDTGQEPVKCCLPQQTRPTEPDNDTNVDETIQRLLHNDPGLVNINLNNMKRTPIPQIKRIIEAMKKSEFIQQLSLANMGLYDKDVASLIDTIGDSESLRKLNLETNYLSGEFFAKLFEATNKNQVVEEVKAVNQGMNFSTQAERDIIKALKENHSLTKISLNIRLPELRNKIQQITMRNQEIRRIMRKKAADEQRALEEQRKRELEEEERRKAELEKARQPMKVFPKELLHQNKKPKQTKPEEPEVRGIAPFIVGEEVKPAKENSLQKQKLTGRPEDLGKKPVLKKLPPLDLNPIISQQNNPSKLENKEWPPKPKERPAAEKPAPKKNPLLTKWASIESEDKDVKKETAPAKKDAPPKSTPVVEEKVEPTKKLDIDTTPTRPKPRRQVDLPDAPLSPSSLDILGMDLGAFENKDTKLASATTKTTTPRRTETKLNNGATAVKKSRKLESKFLDQDRGQAEKPSEVKVFKKAATQDRIPEKVAPLPKLSPEPTKSSELCSPKKAEESTNSDEKHIPPTSHTSPPKAELLPQPSTGPTESSVGPDSATGNESDVKPKKKKIVKRIVRRKKVVKKENPDALLTSDSDAQSGLSSARGVDQPEAVPTTTEAPKPIDIKTKSAAEPEPKSDALEKRAPESKAEEIVPSDVSYTPGRRFGQWETADKREPPAVPPKTPYRSDRSDIRTTPKTDYLATKYSGSYTSRNRLPYSSGLNRYTSRF